MPKHVASHTLSETTWNAELLEGDAAEAVAALKERPGADLLKFGTGELDLTLIPAKLVDELHLWLFPVLAGGGQRLLDGIDTTHLRLAETHAVRLGDRRQRVHAVVGRGFVPAPPGPCSGMTPP